MENYEKITNYLSELWKYPNDFSEEQLEILYKFSEHKDSFIDQR